MMFISIQFIYRSRVTARNGTEHREGCKGGERGTLPRHAQRGKGGDLWHRASTEPGGRGETGDHTIIEGPTSLGLTKRAFS